MAKRFTDTGKWQKLWFSELSPIHKCFWMYLLDSCTPSGIWEVNWKLASFHVGAKLDEKRTAQAFRKQFVELDQGRRWFIKDFIPFQYGGGLHANNPAHKGPIEDLRRYSLLAPDYSIVLPVNEVEGPSEGLGSTWSGTMDMDKDKDKDKDKAKDEEKLAFGEFQNVKLTIRERQRLADRLGSDERAHAAIEILSSYKKSKRKEYNSDYATFATWVIDALETQESKSQNRKNGGSSRGFSKRREIDGAEYQDAVKVSRTMRGHSGADSSDSGDDRGGETNGGAHHAATGNAHHPALGIAAAGGGDSGHGRLGNQTPDLRFNRL